MADTEVIQNGVANGEMDEVNSESKEDIGKQTEEKEEEEKAVDEEPLEDSREQGDGSEEQATNEEHESLDSRGGDDPREEPEQQKQEEEGGVEEESSEAPGGEEESQVEEDSSRNERKDLPKSLRKQMNPKQRCRLVNLMMCRLKKEIVDLTNQLLSVSATSIVWLPLSDFSLLVYELMFA